MKIKHSLKKRITKSFILLALLLSGFFTFVSYSSVEYIEAQLIDHSMEKMIDRMISQYRENKPVDTLPDTVFFANEDVPKQWRNLDPGIHELWLDNRELQALVVVDGNDRFVVAYEMTEFEHTEEIIFTTLATGFASSLLLALLLGFITAKQVVAPVSELADAVDRNEDPGSFTSLHAENEIGVLARAFATRTDQLQRFLIRERLFTGDVSHELRTPLTIMLGAAEMLKAQLADRPVQFAAAERIRRVAVETAERVSALLMLSRSPELIDAPRIALNPLIQAEIDRYRYLLEGKPVLLSFQFSQEVTVNTLPELAGIVLGNLLRNACQHTDAGRISVQLSTDKLIIEDTGPGIPVSVRDRLFERFVQGDDSSSEGTGLGLGLSIVKRVVEHVGWDIQLECPSEGGSRFTIFIANTGRPIPV